MIRIGSPARVFGLKVSLVLRMFFILFSQLNGKPYAKGGVHTRGIVDEDDDDGWCAMLIYNHRGKSSTNAGGSKICWPISVVAAAAGKFRELAIHLRIDLIYADFSLLAVNVTLRVLGIVQGGFELTF